MLKDVFQFECPCCGKTIEVNTRSGKARAADPKDSKKADFDKLVSEQSSASDRLGSMFDDARADQSADAKRLEGLFDRAKEKSKDDDPKGRPSNPFDLD